MSSHSRHSSSSSRTRNDRNDERHSHHDRSSRQDRNRNWHSHSSKHSSHSKDYEQKRKRSRSRSRERSNDHKKNKVQEIVTPVEAPIEDYQKRIEEQLAQTQEHTDVDKLMEERRLKRQAILAKYQKEKEEQQVANESSNLDSPVSGNEPISSPELPFASPSPLTEELLSVNTQDQPTPIQEVEIMAKVEQTDNHKEEEQENSSKILSEDSNFDMFGDSPVIPTIQKKTLNNSPSGIPQNPTILETDAEGYCDLPIGTILNGRYQIGTRLGTGMFSKVFKAYDLEQSRDVAIKVIRNNDMMKRAGTKEIEVLQLLANNDPEDRFYCARLITHFEDREFLCLVFELEGSDLLDVIKKYGRGIGLSVKAVQVYAKQLFLALYHLKRVGLIHADLKPTNILVNESRTKMRLSDFGSAIRLEEAETAPFLVTGWFRPPEVILGLKYGYPIDMWSAGCTLYELATGKVLFQGSSNNDMLRMHLAAKGKDTFTKKLLKKAEYFNSYFDEHLNFLEKRIDPVTGREYVHSVVINEPTRDIQEELMRGQPVNDQPKVLQLVDLIKKTITLDPTKRITPEEALKHPFFSSL